MKFTNIIIRVLLLVVSVFIIAFGTALSIRANLGCAPVSVPPYVWSLAGGMEVGHFCVPEWTVGTYTFVLYVICVVFQIVLLRRRYQPVQLLQFLIAIIAGFFLDVSMELTEAFQWPSVSIRVIQLLLGGFIMALGISLEVLARLLLKPSDGFILAVTQVAKIDFGKMKIIYDTSLVLLGIICMLLFFKSWHWNMVGVGTLISMVYVGFCVRLLHPLMSWLEGKLY